MKSQVFNSKENREWLNVILPVSIVLLMVLLVPANNMVKSSHQSSGYEQKTTEMQNNPIVKGEVSQSEIPAFGPLEESTSAENVAESSSIENNESAFDEAFLKKIEEYAQPEVEEPLEVEDWMLDEKYWQFDL